jgi:hypothetical protein
MISAMAPRYTLSCKPQAQVKLQACSAKVWREAVLVHLVGVHRVAGVGLLLLREALLVVWLLHERLLLLLLLVRGRLLLERHCLLLLRGALRRKVRRLLLHELVLLRVVRVGVADKPGGGTAAAAAGALQLAAAANEALGVGTLVAAAGCTCSRQHEGHEAGRAWWHNRVGVVGALVRGEGPGWCRGGEEGGELQTGASRRAPAICVPAGRGAACSGQGEIQPQPACALVQATRATRALCSNRRQLKQR